MRGCDLVFNGIHVRVQTDEITIQKGIVKYSNIEKQLVPALPKTSIITMDNASYHNIRVEGTKPPTSSSGKSDMTECLTKLDVQFDSKSTKPKLYEIIKSKKNRFCI